jgi:hypothetical protein
MHLWTLSVRADATSVYSVSVAAVSGHARATNVQDSLVELLSTYFLPTFPLRARVAVGFATTLGSSSSSEMQPAEHLWSLAYRRPD